MRRTRALTLSLAAALAASVLAACGSDDADAGDEGARPTVAVTTTVDGEARTLSGRPVRSRSQRRRRDRSDRTSGISSNQAAPR